MNLEILAFVPLGLFVFVLLLLLLEKRKVAKLNFSIAQLEKDKSRLEENLEAFAKITKRYEAQVGGLAKALNRWEEESDKIKSELESMAKTWGMDKMDDGILFRKIEQKDKYGRALLSNWLPYGMQLGRLVLIEQTRKVLSGK